jgi:hypothetical protein
MIVCFRTAGKEHCYNIPKLLYNGKPFVSGPEPAGGLATGSVTGVGFLGSTSFAVSGSGSGEVERA